MILEQIDKDLLKMAEESDVVLKDIYKNNKLIGTY